MSDSAMTGFVDLKCRDGDHVYQRDRWKCATCWDNMKAENTRLRAALEAAPDPHSYWQDNYAYESQQWFYGPRAEALRGGVK